MTKRLYYDDPYQTAFSASVVATGDDRRRIYLDRTAFYPTSGGQPFDTGSLGGVAVIEVVDEEDRIAHVLAEPLSEGDAVDGLVDWSRRFDHMQQHTGQHLLSAVLEDLYQIPTVSFHLGQESATIDVGVASLSVAQIEAAERRANELVWEDRAVRVDYEEASQAQGLRKASEREGVLRIVSIADLDRSACGGTHVRSTGVIGAILLRKIEKIRGNVRIEFLCGGRATARARRDFDALTEVSRVLSAPLDSAPSLVAGLIARVADLDKSRRKIAMELAGFQGRQLYASAAPDATGRRCVKQSVGAVDEEIRALAQGFVAGSNAAFLAVEPMAFLLAVSADSGLHAGNMVKAAVGAVGGRGGGNAQVAQGSAPSADKLREALAAIEAILPVR